MRATQVVLVVLLLLVAGSVASHDPPHRHSYVASVVITAHMPGTHFSGWVEQGLLLFEAPQVHDPAETYRLDDFLSCDQGYDPQMAWHEIIGSWPDSSIMYSVNANVTDAGEIEVALRTRQGYSRGYAYVEVLVLCTPV